MRKERKHRRIMCLAAISLLLFYCPLQVAGDKELSGNMRIAVKAESAQIYKKTSEQSEVVKTVDFGRQMRAKQICGDWYQVSGGYIRKDSAVL